MNQNVSDLLSANTLHSYLVSFPLSYLLLTLDNLGLGARDERGEEVEGNGREANARHGFRSLPPNLNVRGFRDARQSLQRYT